MLIGTMEIDLPKGRDLRHRINHLLTLCFPFEQLTVSIAFGVMHRMEGSMMSRWFGRVAGLWQHSGDHSSNKRIVEACAERRKRLTAGVKAENPSYTESEIEARLEQFGV